MSHGPGRARLKSSGANPAGALPSSSASSSAPVPMMVVSAVSPGCDTTVGPSTVTTWLTCMFVATSSHEAWIAVSEEVKRSIPAALKGRIEVVVHGIVVAEAKAKRARRAEVRAAWGMQPDEVVVATVANYRMQKAYPDLLNAARQVIDSGLPVRFIAIGQGPLEDEVKAQHAVLGLRDRFELPLPLSDCTKTSLGSHTDEREYAMVRPSGEREKLSTEASGWASANLDRRLPMPTLASVRLELAPMLKP